MKSDFIKCGMTGWCLEILWTGLQSLLRHDRKLTGVSSLHMFPIYGAAALVGPLSHRLKGCWMPLRGLIYMTGFFGVEYVSGSFLKKYDCCPWDYSKAPLQIGGVIRLDYAPLWFATGLLYEKMLCARNRPPLNKAVVPKCQRVGQT